MKKNVHSISDVMRLLDRCIDKTQDLMRTLSNDRNQVGTLLTLEKDLQILKQSISMAEIWNGKHDSPLEALISQLIITMAKFVFEILN